MAASSSHHNIFQEIVEKWRVKEMEDKRETEIERGDISSMVQRFWCLKGRCKWDLWAKQCMFTEWPDRTGQDRAGRGRAGLGGVGQGGAFISSCGRCVCGRRASAPAGT